MILMIWFILAIIITIIITIFYGINGGDWFEAILFSSVTLMITFVVALFLSYIFYSPDPDGYIANESRTKELYAISDNTQISGGGFIFVSINEDDMYSYIIKNEDGTYSRESIPCDDVKIKEDDSITPKIEYYIRASENTFFSLWEDKYCQITVPEGTVVNTFNIDLEG